MAKFGLLDALKQYVSDAMPGGLLNAEVDNQSLLDGAAIASTPVPIAGDLLGLAADVHRYKTDPESRTMGNYALSGLGLLPFVPAMTAWHGSPHLIGPEGFKNSAIGTGEGHQAYGDGHYLAEAKDVGIEYRKALNPQYHAATAPDGTWDVIRQDRARAPMQKIAEGLPNHHEAKAILQSMPQEGYLYKTDIPDEAVNRFLDWDRPLSQQAPEVQAAINKIGIADAANGEDLYWKLKRTKYSQMESMPAHKNSKEAQSYASKLLQENGVPGIRYLDDHSRAAGKGTSNFVVFDPEMIRILERNGQATGLEPWKAGEYGLLGQ